MELSTIAILQMSDIMFVLEINNIFWSMACADQKILRRGPASVQGGFHEVLPFPTHNLENRGGRASGPPVPPLEPRKNEVSTRWVTCKISSMIVALCVCNVMSPCKDLRAGPTGDDIDSTQPYIGFPIGSFFSEPFHQLVHFIKITTWFDVFSLYFCLVISRFGFEGWIWVLIASVPIFAYLLLSHST